MSGEYEGPRSAHMRYIGSKENLLDFIAGVAAERGITRGTFCDLFTGTTCVARHFKAHGFRIISNDIQHYSYVLQRAYIGLNDPPGFETLLHSPEGVALSKTASTPLP